MSSGNVATNILQTLVHAVKPVQKAINNKKISDNFNGLPCTLFLPSPPLKHVMTRVMAKRQGPVKQRLVKQWING